MNDLADLIQPTPEVGMKHFDKSVEDSTARQQQNMAAKEASFVQAVGYVPTSNISAQDWEDQVHRNKVSKARGGLYRQKADPARSGSMY